MNHARATVLATIVGVMAMLGPCADAGALFVPVADSFSRTAAVADVPTERLVRVARNELASVRSQVTSTGAGRLLLNVGTELNLDIAIERTAPTRWGYSLSGRINDPTGGFVTLVVHDEAVAGTIWTPEASYEVVHLGGGVHAVRELVDDGHQCGGAVAASRTPLVLPQDTHAAEENTVVDVLVVWTPQREEEAGGEDAVRAEIELGIAYTNDAFDRSGAFVSLNLVGAEPAPDYEEPKVDDANGHRRINLDRLENPDDGHMDAVHLRRDVLGADLVSLATHVGGGRAQVLGAFNISGRSPGTVAHEFGHNFGLFHERAITRSRHFQHGYVALRERRCSWTIMAYGTACVRHRGKGRDDVPLFSSPVLFHPIDGARLGISRFSESRGADGPADSVLHLNRARDTIARFKRRR